MAKDYDQIIWSTQTEIDLESILTYYLEFSSDKAYTYINDIIDAVEQTVFSDQWQVDEYDPSCRRIIVKKNSAFITKLKPKLYGLLEFIQHKKTRKVF